MPHPTTSTQDNPKPIPYHTVPSEPNPHVGRCLTSEMTRKQGPILPRMVLQCVVSVQIGVKNFPMRGPNRVKRDFDFLAP